MAVKGKRPFKRGDKVVYIDNPKIVGDIDVTEGCVYTVTQVVWDNYLPGWVLYIYDDVGESNLLYAKSVRLAEPSYVTDDGARQYEEAMLGLDLVKIKS